MKKEFDTATQSRIDAWLKGPYDEASKAEIRRLKEENPRALSDAFFKTLSFGTGGMRGIMGVGTNRMNIYTVRKATQGLANYVKKKGGKSPSVFIGYDTRRSSREFAEEAARVLAGNEIHVHIAQEICPTPLASFGCRYFGCTAAIMITASHNPPEYNGYKVYWADGAQIVPPHDKGIIHEVEVLQEEARLAALDSSWVHWVDDACAKAYLKEVGSLQLHPGLDKEHVKIVYSPLHGTGIRLLPQALSSWGFSHVFLVDKQSQPDGAFPHAPSPNPEDKGALRLGTEQLQKVGGDLFLATDPDADRIGVVVKGGVVFSGNQVACILLDHIGRSLKIPPHATVIKTIVTTEMFAKIASYYGASCIDVLTGFKYIGEKIHEWETKKTPHHFLFGAEESCGYLFGSFVRDKDAISSACLVAEAAALAKQEHKTLVDRLYELYLRHGVHRESLTQISLSDSQEGMQQMDELMQRLRSNPPQAVGGQKVRLVEDYKQGFQGLPPSDAIRIWLEDQSKLVIRPSGTEPKVKIYAEVVEIPSQDLTRQIAKADHRLHTMVNAFHKQVV